MLHLMHLLARNLNVDSIWSCNGPELTETWRVSHCLGGSTVYLVDLVELAKLLRRY